MNRSMNRRPLLAITVIVVVACTDNKPRVVAQSSVAPAIGVAPMSTQPDSKSSTLDAQCLRYGPIVELRGTLRRETHPGRPNYESIRDGDEAETGFYLHLTAPICTRASRPDVYDEQSVDSVRRVQLLLDSAGYARLRPNLTKQVTVSGVLSSALTGHHHAPLLLQVRWPNP